MQVNSDQNLKTFEINELVSEAITNATERRKKAAELSDLSSDELDGIVGGLASVTGRWTTSGIYQA